MWGKGNTPPQQPRSRIKKVQGVESSVLFFYLLFLLGGTLLTVILVSFLTEIYISHLIGFNN